MLFHVKMIVRLPHDLPQDVVDDLRTREKAVAADLQRAGKWPHLWRIAGQTGNISILDVPDAAALHDALTSLPLFPFMQVEVTALCKHPSSIA